MIIDHGMAKLVNRFMSLIRSNLNNYIIQLINSYNIIIQYVDNKKVQANSAVIRFENANYIFINNNLPDRLLLLVFMHEVAHIKKGYLGEKYIKYNKKIEWKVNNEAIKMLRSFYPLSTYIILLFSLLISEEVLYSNFLKFNNLVPEVLLCQKKNI